MTSVDFSREILAGRLIPSRRQALALVRKFPGIKGICRECGCSPLNACVNQGFFEDETCSWSDQTKTLCSAIECQIAAKQQPEKSGRSMGYNPPKPKTRAIALSNKGEQPCRNRDSRAKSHRTRSPQSQ